MTLRYDENGRPVGLDWTVVTDGKNDKSVWDGSGKTKPAPKKKAIKNPGVGRGALPRLADEIEDQIITMYTDETKSAQEIARVFNITPKTVYRVLDRNLVPTRSMSEAMKISHQRRNS